MAYGNYGGQSYGGGGGGGGYSTTSYGAQGGADGGGFMGGSQGGSQGAGKGTYGKETLRPVTILQVLSAEQPHPDSDFRIDEVELTQLCFVGQIRNISRQTTKMTYKLDDGTGTVEVTVWIDIDAPTHDDSGNALRVVGRGMSGKENLEEGQWAKVWGNLKSFNNKRYVGAVALRGIKDWNEVSAHLLEATFVHLYFTKGAPEQLNGAVAAGGAGGDAQMNGGGGGQDTVMGGQMQQRGNPNLGLHGRKVLECLRNTEQGNEGLHVQMIANATGMSVADVMKGGDDLMNQSMIFTTVDDNTWALLES